MIHYEYVLVLALVGVLAYLIGFSNGAKFAMREFDKKLDKQFNWMNKDD